MMRLYAILLAVFAVGCGVPVNDAEIVVPLEDTVRTIAQGEVVGFETVDGAHSWRGLPFAAPPVGDLRWRAPRPPEKWSGRRDATQFASRCAQISNFLNASEGIEPGLFLGSEDCLYLDIYAPPDAAGRDLPVMVWIHGGSNVWGRSSSYDGSRIAVNEDVILVAAQYRLGPFGWFAHPAVRASAETKEDAGANFATLDLIQSLKWVRDNIRVFGGDPENVTIVGESAGGHNVVTLLASPLAKGLFHKSIIQSGVFDSVSMAVAEGTEPGAANPSNKIAEKLNAKTADALRAVSAEDFLKAYDENARGRLSVPVVIEDGVVLPATSMRETFAKKGGFNAVPTITGTNRDEMRFFHLAAPQLTKRVFGIFLQPRDPKFYEVAAEYPSRIWKIMSVDEPADAMIKAGHLDVYAYRFDWDDGGRFLLTDLGKLVGAGHAVEIPFVFNRFELFGPKLDPILFAKKTAKERETLSRTMGAYWASFARNGTPSAPDAPVWRSWVAGEGARLRFDAKSDGGVEMISGRDSLEKLKADFVADPRLSHEDRCMIIELIRIWTTPIADELVAAVECKAAA